MLHKTGQCSVGKQCLPETRHKHKNYTDIQTSQVGVKNKKNKEGEVYIGNPAGIVVSYG